MTPCYLLLNSNCSNLDCSFLGLSKVPKRIPHSIKQLNLSHNVIDDAFFECCEDIKILDLSYNKISSLTQRYFERMKNIQILLLAANNIRSFSPNTFEVLSNLKHLDLRNNPIELQGSPNEGFLISSSLNELNLDNCDIKELKDGMFNNLTQLTHLTLSGNLFDGDIDTFPFEPLQSLLKLRINNLSKPSIYLLCEKLVAIDIINFDDFNISCTILSDNEPFDESIINNDPTEGLKMDPIVFQPSTIKKEIVLESTTIESFKQITGVPATTEKSSFEASEKTSTNVTNIDSKTAAFDIGIETIKLILLCMSRFFFFNNIGFTCVYTHSVHTTH